MSNERRRSSKQRDKLVERRYLLVGFAILQCFLGAGVVFGWTSILPMLEKEGIYNEYCVNNEAFCNEQSIRLHFAFTIAASCSMCANLFMGLVFDRDPTNPERAAVDPVCHILNDVVVACSFGPRLAKAIANICLIGGAVLMSNAHNRCEPTGRPLFTQNFAMPSRMAPGMDLFLPGMALLAFGGTGLQLCSIHLSNLFPEAKSLVTCLIVGALQLSFFIFGIFNFMYQHLGLSQHRIFEGYAVVLGGSLVGTLILNPDKPIQLEDQLVDSTHPEHHELLSPIRLPSVFKKGEASLLLSTPQLSKYDEGKKPLVAGQSAAGATTHSSDLSTRSFRTQLTSPPFVLLTFLFSVGTLWCNYFLGSVTAQLRAKGLAPDVVTQLMGYFDWILPGGVVFIPLVGYLLEVCGYTLVTFLFCFTSLAFTALFWSSTPWVIVVSFITYSLCRTITFSLLFAYIGHTFGFKNFGALSGIAFCVAAIAGLLQTPITELNDFRLVSYIQTETEDEAVRATTGTPPGAAAPAPAVAPTARQGTGRAAAPARGGARPFPRQVQASVAAARALVRTKMSRFSIANVMGRKSNTSDADTRPSVISVTNLNRQLAEETKKTDQHLFFGPQQGVFDGKDRTRVIHGERKIMKNSKKVWLVSEPLSMDRDSTTSLVGFPEQPKQGILGSGMSSTLSAAGRFLGQKVAQMKLPSTHVNDDSFCDGCGMDPIVGNMFTCSKCEDNYSLCESCYQSGVHGYEDSELIRSLREDFALRSIVETCKHRVPEKVFTLLMQKVCRGQIDKFHFLANWISGVVLGHSMSELPVRGIEIPHLDNETRTTLVELLTPVLAERNDIEVCLEWFTPDAENDELPSSKRKLETVRIWVATDKDSKSPFAPKTDTDNESDRSFSPGNSPRLSGSPPMSPVANDVGSPPPSPVARSPKALGAETQEEYYSDSERPSVSSDILTTKVDSMSASGEPSEGIAM
ncbi:TPA: hypothetical protein N0F65_002423 [Lagenidium giganteum]|uniref:ZZ-type domain-containing protein n=1 Tax=Lagenidium giganteum TaxID=4803 RepID=A0AAV2YLJ0_9STRA|nr:TPA: hypothetical protein N0F65_002423 [Lagenidium giganteum]